MREPDSARYVGRWPVTWDLILRRLDAASTEQEANEAAKTFRWWAGAGKIAALEIPCPFAKSLPNRGCQSPCRPLLRRELPFFLLPGRGLTLLLLRVDNVGHCGPGEPSGPFSVNCSDPSCTETGRWFPRKNFCDMPPSVRTWRSFRATRKAAQYGGAWPNDGFGAPSSPGSRIRSGQKAAAKEGRIGDLKTPLRS
jgi:hypothetical protein